MANTTRQPWERRDNETTAAYRAFCVYRDMGLERSVRGAASKARKRPRNPTAPPPKDSRYLEWHQWFKNHDWDTRAKAWDDHQQRIALQAKENVIVADAQEWAKRRTEALEQQWRSAQQYADQATRIMQQVGEHGLDAKTARDWVAVLNTATALIRDAIETALPDDDDFDPSTATIEELKAFLDRKDKARRAKRPVATEGP